MSGLYAGIRMSITDVLQVAGGVMSLHKQDPALFAMYTYWWNLESSDLRFVLLKSLATVNGPCEFWKFALHILCINTGWNLHHLNEQDGEFLQ